MHIMPVDRLESSFVWLSEMCVDGNLFSRKGTLVHKVLSLQRKEYNMVGHVIALSLLYGGAAPHFLLSRLLLTFK